MIKAMLSCKPLGVGATATSAAFPTPVLFIYFHKEDIL